MIATGAVTNFAKTDVGNTAYLLRAMLTLRGFRGDIAVFDAEFQRSDSFGRRSAQKTIHNYFFLKGLDLSLIHISISLPAVSIAESRVASVCSGLGLVVPSVMDEPFGVSVSPSCQPGMVISDVYKRQL